MSLSVAEAKRLIQLCFPQGSEQLYAWDDPAANIGQFFNVLGQVWKTYGSDLVDALRREIYPITVEQNIPVWESALGLSNTPVAKFGTPAQRRSAILSWLRQRGTFCRADIQALVQPFFLYEDPSEIQILESSRLEQTLLHTYSNTTPLPIAPDSFGASRIAVLDDPRVSPAGVAVTINVGPATVDQIRIGLDGPDGTRASWRGDVYLGSGFTGAASFVLRSKRHAGKPIKGEWKLDISTGPGAFTLQSWALSPIEGLGVNFDRAVPPNRIGQGLGAAMFDWAVVAEEDKLGSGYDLTAALRALRRMKPAHTQCTIIWQASGFPDACAIPDTRSAVPDAAIPCS